MQIYSTKEFNYIRTSELPEPERSQLEKYMYGQTRPYIDKLGEDQDAVFLSDYDYFLDFLAGRCPVFD